NRPSPQKLSVRAEESDIEIFAIDFSGIPVGASLNYKDSGDAESPPGSFFLICFSPANATRRHRGHCGNSQMLFDYARGRGAKRGHPSRARPGRPGTAARRDVFGSHQRKRKLRTGQRALEYAQRAGEQSPSSPEGRMTTAPEELLSHLEAERERRHIENRLAY